MNRTILLLIVVTGNILPSFAQETERPVSNCKPESARAKLSVELFVSAPHQLDSRSEVGATNETMEQIAVVGDETICSSLMNFINANT